MRTSVEFTAEAILKTPPLTPVETSIHAPNIQSEQESR